MNITIAIPTYNRSFYLSRLLSRLSEVNLRNAQILIVDNCSTDDTEEVVQKYASGIFKNIVKYCKNSVNIGAEANILRCFELADTEWLWIIGDDDIPVINCMDILYNVIVPRQDCQYFNFATTILALRTARRSGFITSGIAELVTHLDCYSNFLFISAGIYKRPSFLKYLPNAYRYIYAYSVQLALIFSVMAESSYNKCYFSPDHLVEWEPPAKDIAWNQELFNYGAPFVAEVLSSFSLRDEFITKIRYIQEIAPSLTLRKILTLCRDDSSQLISIERQYNILASLTPSYSAYAFAAHLLVMVSRRPNCMRCISIIDKVSKSKYAALARAASSLLDVQLLSRDIRIPVSSPHEAQMLLKDINSVNKKQ
jgi:abequosyltransferase